MITIATMLPDVPPALAIAVIATLGRGGCSRRCVGLALVGIVVPLPSTGARRSRGGRRVGNTATFARMPRPAVRRALATRGRRRRRRRSARRQAAILLAPATENNMRTAASLLETVHLQEVTVTAVVTTAGGSRGRGCRLSGSAGGVGRAVQLVRQPVPSLTAGRRGLRRRGLMRNAAVLVRVPVPAVGRALSSLRRLGRVRLATVRNTAISLLEASELSIVSHE